MHGGKSRKGVASATFKHGRRSKYLPHALMETYGRMLTDPDLLSLNEDIATLEPFIERELKKAGEDGTEAYKRYLELTEQKRKLVETEARRREKMQTLIPVEDATYLIGALIDAVHRHLEDQDTLAKIADEWARILGKVGPEQITEKQNRN